MYYFFNYGKDIDMKKSNEIEKIRKDVKELMGKDLKVAIRGVRGKIDTVVGNISAVNKNIVVLDVNDGIRKHISLSYGDIISGRAKMEEMK